MKKIYLLVIALSLISCNKSVEDATKIPKNITSIQDYERFLDINDNAVITQLDQDIDSLKNHLSQSPTAVTVLGQLFTKLNQRYDLKANIQDLNEAVAIQEQQVAHMYVKPNAAKHSLAQSYIKQHRFKKADSLMKSFATDKLSRESQMIYFDIAMELGDYPKALKMLDSLHNPNDYNYLIRAAKWNDYKGDLDATIRLMENAKELADSSGNPSLQLWSNSNIADYYGHKGEISKSYEHYLKTLKIDPSNSYAMKGIAWIVYAHENNPTEATRILKTLKKRHPLPDYDLAIAEILKFQEKNHDAELLRKSFLDEVNQPSYGAMYNTYKVEQLLEGSKKEQQQALEIARTEINNRSTPETQSLLSYSLLKNGFLEKALENQEQFVLNKTFEPVAQLHSYEIFTANNKRNEVEALREEIAGAAYELGPVTMKGFHQIQ